SMIADRLKIPDSARAILWDMDGVLLDTLGLDFVICNELLNRYTDQRIELSKAFIRSIFAYHPPQFWRLILEFVNKEHGILLDEDIYEKILASYNEIRNDSVFKVNPGILEILTDCRDKGIKTAVVSNNPVKDVKKILKKSGIIDFFDLVVGNDMGDFEKKPSPDTYLYAMHLLGYGSDACIVIEDSLIGVQAGHSAGCFTIGVATGGESFAVLERSGHTDMVYDSFESFHINMNFGNVTEKSIFTPNEFVSHMIEHIAWRLCCKINLSWNCNDWFALGKAMGFHIRDLGFTASSAAALGMIDDGSVEVSITTSDFYADSNLDSHLDGETDIAPDSKMDSKMEPKMDSKMESEIEPKIDSDNSIPDFTPGLEMEAIEGIDLKWFLSLRCEQLQSGKPLVDMLKGMCSGLNTHMFIRICSMEDPHHCWEGVFRSVGIALKRMTAPVAEIPESDLSIKYDEKTAYGDGLTVEEKSLDRVKVTRKTAESNVSVTVDFAKTGKLPGKLQCAFDVSSSVNISGFTELLRLFAENAGFFLKVEYAATVLSSSHVIMEDTALVTGRALKEILVLRMDHQGINGAGSSILKLSDLDEQPIRVGISVEGRKFWSIIPFNASLQDLKRKFIIGQTVLEDLFSEDLDDFIDGLSGGLGCSIVVHVKEMIEADEGWQMIFAQLGRALAEVFELNPWRKGASPGVKMTLT
ncbi:HAD family phosphatase, partial [Desulfobacterales bacterium HSG16]|nr:HAD family phosphatase [Desulfobacterales bacterium HSG16]